MTDNLQSVLAALRKEAESNDGGGWWTVYLDNAFGQLSGVSRHQFAGYLSALTDQGLYRPIDDPDFQGAFGQVKV